MIITCTFLVLTLTSFIKRMLKLHDEIGGRWFAYWSALRKVKAYQKANPKGRLDVHDVFSNNIDSGTFISFLNETKYAKPKEVSFKNLIVNFTF